MHCTCCTAKAYPLRQANQKGKHGIFLSKRKGLIAHKHFVLKLTPLFLLFCVRLTLHLSSSITPLVWYTRVLNYFLIFSHCYSICSVSYSVLCFSVNTVKASHLCRGLLLFSFLHTAIVAAVPW